MSDDELKPAQRAEFPVFRSLSSRWMDNDHYGHINNVIYYSYFDTAVNGWLMAQCARDIRELPAIGLVVETRCRYFAPLSFPDAIEVGIALERIGRSSIIYRLGVFRAGEAAAVAVGRFVHVYVDRASRAATEIPREIRAALSALQG
ncbi:MAG: thioesterase family protein [Steroidobacteraceae bacterium]